MGVPCLQVWPCVVVDVACGLCGGCCGRGTLCKYLGRCNHPVAAKVVTVPVSSDALLPTSCTVLVADLMAMEQKLGVSVHELDEAPTGYLGNVWGAGW